MRDRKTAHSSQTGRLSALGLRGRLMLALIPSVVVFLMAAGLGNYGVSNHYIHQALERFIRLQNLAVAHEVEGYLNQVREDLLFLSHDELTESSMREFLQGKAASGGIRYLELAYLAPTGNDHVMLFRHQDHVVRIDTQELSRVIPNPLLLFGDLGNLQPGQVRPLPVMEVQYPISRPGLDNGMTRLQAIRFVTPYLAKGQSKPGLLILSICARDIRNILTLFNSAHSPLWAFPRSDELRYDYMVDTKGWMLFQSGTPETTATELSTHTARSGYEGTLGRPDLREAFRPNSDYGYFWTMMKQLREGHSGISRLTDHRPSSQVNDYYFAYAPVMFTETSDTPPVVYGGIVRVDRSILPIIAGYRYLDIMLLITVAAICLFSLLIYWLGRKLTSPIRQLSEQLNALREVDDLEDIVISYGGKDIEDLKNAVNAMVVRIRHQMEEIREKDKTIFSVNQREPADLSEEQNLLGEVRLSVLPSIIGIGPKITELKNDVLKAAQVEVDVLITGETGTGKQLVAEAIHGQSSRKNGPFISINCGALDENLLQDALFGHVKGAFTEAKTDRNGAFVQAGSGTLFLDEIQSASPKVQQSLLRALAIRRIKPLGSDVEVPIDVRIIAATNLDLTELIEKGRFREDLYYRLKVVSINVPSLREHPENIALLALHYLQQAEQLTGREKLHLSKGALRKLSAYDWPGNVRELVNSITRAVVMAETDTIQQEEIRLEQDAMDQEYIPVITERENQHEVPDTNESVKVSEHPSPSSGKSDTTTSRSPITEFNDRQRSAWNAIQARGTITRSGYQELIGGDLSPRTANYDLNDLVGKGMLVKKGKGPATRYEVVPKIDPDR